MFVRCAKQVKKGVFFLKKNTYSRFRPMLNYLHQREPSKLRSNRWIVSSSKGRLGYVIFTGAEKRGRCHIYRLFSCRLVVRQLRTHCVDHGRRSSLFFAL
jgi:hypothetical protein